MQSGRKKILIVDDEAHIRFALCSCLEADGYDVEEARNGAEAIRVILDTRPDLMLLDLAMPHMDGMQMLHELRAHYRDVMPRVIILTAWNSIAGQEEAFLHGVCDYVAKPITPKLLSHVVARVLHDPDPCAGMGIDPTMLTGETAAENYLG